MMFNNLLTRIRQVFHQRPLKAQFAQTQLILLLCLTIGLLAVTGVSLLSRQFEVPLSYFTRDPAAITETAFYIGALSSLGVALWSATAAICFFGAAILVRSPRHQYDARFFLSSGLISSMLALDDAFLLHETFFPLYLQFPERGIYLVYLLLVSGFLFYFRAYILETDYLLLFLAFMFLGSGLVVEFLLPFSELETFAEDSLKFFGILFWLGYFARATSTTLRLNLLYTERHPSWIQSQR